ncbi:short-chain dehydrogenase [Metarhizobium album]|uniref:Short-chain dehydrogenase n=1 Tax=Metarhizobium album TaxID=2182425 RepID=A0A2U2DR94_9HYPH|nr:SDR family oxidoreductase [Rhizobium album]PWE55836.1 short-chain dehydrogenase [Rhizobium album]
MQTAIVTGASKGLGRAIAIELGRAGYAVVVAARDQAGLDETVELAKAAGAPATLAVAADLSQPEAPDAVVKAALDAFGRIDVVVNNAGATKRGDFFTLTEEDFISGFALKFHATVRFCRAAWPALAKAGGSIVNISGIGAHTPEPDFTIGGSVNSAIINFTKALSKRAAVDNIRMNVLCPGHIVTDRLEARIKVRARDQGISFEQAREEMRLAQHIDRYGTPEEIAHTVAFLVSDKASYIQGTVINVDGGATPGI